MKNPVSRSINSGDLETNSTRRELRNLAGRFRGGKLAPVMMTAIKAGESGMLTQSIKMKLDPIAGELLSTIGGQFIGVYIPLQALMYQAANRDDAATSYLTEVLRRTLMAGDPILGMTAEHEISKRCGVNPRSISGTKSVSDVVHIAHNTAINFLRRRLYAYADLVPTTNKAITPALLSSTVLQRLNGVLDPDDRINGEVQLSMPEMRLPVEGFGVISSAPGDRPNVGASLSGVEPGMDFVATATNAVSPDRAGSGAAGTAMKVKTVGGTLRPDVYAVLNDSVSVGGVSLVDFYNAEKMDRFVREAAEIIKQHPNEGEEAVLRWAYDLAVDVDRHPFILFEREGSFMPENRPAQDGIGLMDEVSRTDNVMSVSVTVPVPRTELGGIIITFATVKPDEKIQFMPHPFLSAPWVQENKIAEELKLDPVPVTMRELDADIALASENTIAFYTGHNELKRSYIDYGFTRQTDASTVENKTAIWQIAVPASVTPENIVYPADLDHYPFADQLAEICTYNTQSVMQLQTPIFFGPTPVEAVSAIQDDGSVE